jgi:hypothetical protein
LVGIGRHWWPGTERSRSAVVRFVGNSGYLVFFLFVENIDAFSLKRPQTADLDRFYPGHFQRNPFWKKKNAKNQQFEKVPFRLLVVGSKKFTAKICELVGITIDGVFSYSIFFQYPALSLPIRSILPSSLSHFIFLFAVLKLIFNCSLISAAEILLFCFISSNTVSFTVSICDFTVSSAGGAK